MKKKSFFFVSFVVKRASFILIIAVLAAALPLCADTIVYTDGRTLGGVVIVGESKDAVTVTMGGAEIVIPRAEIKSITRVSAEKDRQIREDWKKLNEHFTQESREAAAQAALHPEPTSPPPPASPAPAAPAPERQEQIVFPARPPEEAPKGPPRVQPRIRHEQEMHKAIHEKRIVNGMTPEQVQKAWGFPFSTAPVDNVDTHTDRWTYHRDDGRHYVYFKNGKVVSVTAW